MKNISLKEKTRKKAVSPKLYFLVFSAKKLYFTHWGVYHSLEEAREHAHVNLNRGAYGPPPPRNTTWNVESEIMLTPQKIESMFQANTDKVERNKIIEKNVLIKKIIDDKDRKLFEKHKSTFGKKITKYINDRL